MLFVFSILHYFELSGISDGLTTCVASAFYFVVFQKQLENSPSGLRTGKCQVQKGPFISEGPGRKPAFQAKVVSEDHSMARGFVGTWAGLRDRKKG